MDKVDVQGKLDCVFDESDLKRKNTISGQGSGYGSFGRSDVCAC
jgi:hypothetical protein